MSVATVSQMSSGRREEVDSSSIDFKRLSLGPAIGPTSTLSSDLVNRPSTAPESRSRSSPYIDSISRTSTQSLRTSITSLVPSIPEDRPSPNLTGPQNRRVSVLGLASGRSGAGAGGNTGSGNGAQGRARVGRARKEMSREGFEMGLMGAQKGIGGGGGTIFTAVTTGSTTKEELAMAKWRKWAVDQPNMPIVADTSIIRGRKSSASTQSLSPTANPINQPNGSLLPSPPLPLNPSSPLAGPSSSSGWPTSFAPTGPQGSSSRSDSASGSGHHHRMFESSEIYLTDTMLALQDVELAVDEDVAARSLAHRRQSSRATNALARGFDIENPFMEIASRLGSRRIRPIVLELIQALGHYVYTLWSITYPDIPCPLIIPPGDITMPLIQNGGSRTITAVADGQAEGYISTPPSTTELAYWRAEAEYGLRDVNDAVGKWKKQGEVFSLGLKEGHYGDVEDENVLGDEKGKYGGNIFRLLVDLEEVLWGDALPRSTDLSYLLPADFDAYASPSEDDFISQPPAGASAVLGNPFGPPTKQQAFPASPSTAARSKAVMDQVHALPDLIPPLSPMPGLARAIEGDVGGVRMFGTKDPLAPSMSFTNQGVAAAWTERARVSISAQGGLRMANALDAETSRHGQAGLPQVSELSLEEVGRRRHEEWLANQRTAGKTTT